MSIWVKELAIAISAVLAERQEEFSLQPLRMIAIDCHPWSGHLSFGVLTQQEIDSSPILANPDEMAAWTYFEFPSDSVSWHSTKTLAEQMKQAYFRADTPKTIAEHYFNECAKALRTTIVQQAIDHYPRGKDFRLSVAHPDTGQEFYVPRLFGF